MKALVFVLAAVTALAPFSIDMYLPALPTMGRDLQASAADVQLTMAVYMLGSGLGQLAFGPLSDRYGRRLPALAGLVVYILAAIGCALAADVHWLIGFRFAQALGVCCGQVIARAILADLFEPRDLARFSALLSMVQGFAPIIAPLTGGVVFSLLGWRAVFWVLGGYGAAVLAAVALKLPETRTAEARRVSMTENPLASYRAVLSNRPLMGMALVVGFGACAFSIYLANASFLLISHFGVPAAFFGVYFGANAVGLMAASYLNRRLLRRFQVAQVLGVSTLVFVVIAAALAVIVQDPHANKWLVLAPVFALISAFALVVPNAFALAQGEDRARGGSVAAVIGALQGVLGAGAVALCGLFDDGTLRPMAYMILAGTAASAGAFALSGRRRRARS